MCQASHQKRVPYFDDCTIFLKQHWNIFPVFKGSFNVSVIPASRLTRQKVMTPKPNCKSWDIFSAKTTYKATSQKSTLFGGFPWQRTKLKWDHSSVSLLTTDVKNFVAIARPLRKATNHRIFVRLLRHSTRSSYSKHCLTTTLFLVFSCLREPFFLYADASQFSMGAIPQVVFSSPSGMD